VKTRKATLATNVVGLLFPNKGGAVLACNGTETNKTIYYGGKKTTQLLRGANQWKYIQCAKLQNATRMPF
jgi:hypothetical protein